MIALRVPPSLVICPPSLVESSGMKKLIFLMIKLNKCNYHYWFILPLRGFLCEYVDSRSMTGWTDWSEIWDLSTLFTIWHTLHSQSCSFLLISLNNWKTASLFFKASRSRNWASVICFNLLFFFYQTHCFVLRASLPPFLSFVLPSFLPLYFPILPFFSSTDIAEHYYVLSPVLNSGDAWVNKISRMPAFSEIIVLNIY